MANRSRRRSAVTVAVLLVAALLFLLVARCSREVPAPARPVAPSPSALPAEPRPSGAEEPAPPAAEVLGAATIAAPERVGAGAAFAVAWTGPDNPGDFLTVVRPDAPADAYGHYGETAGGSPLELTAPVEPGAFEVRYVTGRSRTVLARAAVEVVAAAATLDAPAEVTLGAPITVAWTGPNNVGDYVTIVPSGAPDDHYGSYAETVGGSPVTLTAPPEAGSAELRYVAGQGRAVLARRELRILAAAVTLSAPERAVAGSTVEVTWTGPDNRGDYVTVVPAGAPDGQYGNYTNTSEGSPLRLLMPISPGAAELRYMTGEGRRVLARRSVTIVAAEITLLAPESCAPGEAVSVAWTGPGHRGDYITIVPAGTLDGRYGAYTETSAGSPLRVAAPKEAGEAEIRYMSGQGGKVLARRPIRVGS